MTIKRKDRIVPVKIAISNLVPVTSNDGGYCGRECLVCGATGYERSSQFGYHYEAKLDGNYQSPGYHMTNDITHKKSCVLNKYINRINGKLL